MGTVVSGAALGTVSVLTAPAITVPPQAAAVDVPAGSEFDQSHEDREAELPQAGQGTPEAGAAPKVMAPEPDDLSSLQGADTAPAGQPETAQPETALSDPATGEDASGVQLDSDSPVLPSPQSIAPEAPDAEGELSISTDPAQPAPPPVEEGGAFDTLKEAAPKDEGAAEAPAPEGSAPEEAGERGDATPDPAQVEDWETAEAPEETGETPTPEAAAPAAPEAEEADGEEAEEADADAPRSGTVGNMADGVTTGRLPSVTDTPEAAAPESDAAEDGADMAEAEAQPEPEPAPPLERFAAPFENPEDKPLMSIVLIDDGDSGIGLEALSGFPYPISFAIDPGWPGAAEAARRYREAGFETLAMAYLPPGASPTDTEVAMQAQMAAVPNAVAVFEAPSADLQSNRAASEQVASILTDSGHGLVMYPQGLNTAQKLIAKEGVPAATLFRDFDAKGQDATVIRRFLDQAAFKASREEDGGVIMVGRLRPDTISALLLWGLQDRASSVALAPVSAVLRGP